MFLIDPIWSRTISDDFLKTSCVDDSLMNFACCLVITAALRVSLAVTWLTVYRQLQVMAPWMIAGVLEAKGFMANAPFKHDMLGMLPSDRDEGLE